MNTQDLISTTQVMLGGDKGLLGMVGERLLVVLSNPSEEVLSVICKELYSISGYGDCVGRVSGCVAGQG